MRIINTDAPISPPTTPITSLPQHIPPPSANTSSRFPYLSALLMTSAMSKFFWPTTPVEQLTPKARQHEQNPFDALFSAPPKSNNNSNSVNSVSKSSNAPRISPSSSRMYSPGPSTPTSVHPLLQTSPLFPSGLSAGGSGSASSDLTPSIGTPSSGPYPAAQPTTQLSLHAPVFNMQQPPPGNRKTTPNISSTSSSSSSSSASASTAASRVSRGQIHVKLIQARGLNVRGPHARPYVVVQFEQNEFVSREPIQETDKALKGVATNRSSSSSTSSSTISNALSALGAIGSKVAAQDARRKGSKSSNKSFNASPPPTSSMLSSTKPSPPNNTLDATTPTLTAPFGVSNGFFGGMSAHNPVWKHEVSFDVTAEDSQLTCSVYDRAVSDQGFLGTVKIKPVLIHDHTLDDWYKVQPVENEVVSGEIRIQITFEQYKTKRALTPRDFEFLKLIGVGTFGKVFQVRKKDTKRIYAMKVLSKKEIVAKKEVAHTIGERKILQRSLDSPFLVGLKFSFQTDTELYLVTDFKSGGELFWHLQRETRFSEERARFYVAELTLALEHLHKYNIVYRDLKPENILLDATGHVALCDFGLSKADLRPDELTTTFCGTTEYLAPEILLDEQGYSKIVDFWSLGVLLFEMCCGWSPFYAEDIQQMYKNICFGKIRFPKGVICEDGKQFVKGLLNRNPKHRLGAQRDAAELKDHPFFKGIDWEALARKEVAPPFKPVVESDESVNNFDPEFTSANIHDIIDGADTMDENDRSAAWVSQSLGQNQMVHTPNGPLGSERSSSGSSQRGLQGLGPLSTLNGTANGVNGHHGNGTNGGSKSIQINTKNKRKDAAGTPLTSSVQENFKGFTYSGESFVVPPGVLSRERSTGEDAVDDEDAPEVTTEDEMEDTSRSAGRYSNRRRIGGGQDSIDEDFS